MFSTLFVEKVCAIKKFHRSIITHQKHAYQISLKTIVRLWTEKILNFFSIFQKMHFFGKNAAPILRSSKVRIIILLMEKY